MAASDKHIKKERERLHREISSLEKSLSPNPDNQVRVEGLLTEKRDELRMWARESQQRFSSGS